MSSYHLPYLLIRIALGGIFIYAGSIKLVAPVSFAAQIEAYGMLPEFLLLPTAVLLPFIEVLAGIGLVFDIRGSLAAITSLLCLFIAILATALWLGLDVDCGCFGPDDPEATAFSGLKTALDRDLVMLAGAIFLYVCRHRGSLRPREAVAVVHQLFGERRKNDARG